jgi:transglutaminase-like putative cysteine protease
MRTELIIIGVALLASCAGTAPSQRFEARHDFTIDVPQGANEVDAWFALPADNDRYQDVEELDWYVNAPANVTWTTTEVRDSLDNRFLHLEAQGAGGAKIAVETSFTVVRREAHVSVDPADTRPLTDGERTKMAAHLASAQHDAPTPAIEADAKRIVGGEKNPVLQARLLYDWVLDHVQYWVKDPSKWKASPVGSSSYCYEQCTGNCTDFHSLYVAAARTVGLPARMVYGSFFKGPLDGKPQDQSYHCWVEVWAPKIGWIPLDVAVADVFVADFTLDDANRPKVELTTADGFAGPDQAMVDFYFGNLEARRVSWHLGRDLVLEGAATAKVNAIPKAHIEIDGKPIEAAATTRMLTFREVR